MMAVGGVYAALDKSPIVSLPTVSSPDMTRSYSKIEPPAPVSPAPKTIGAPEARPKSVATGYLRPGVYRCEDAKGAVSYGDIPCGDGKLVDTKPTSSGFAENWSITVKHR
jgi:hypothetical protein